MSPGLGMMSDPVGIVLLDRRWLDGRRCGTRPVPKSLAADPASI